MAWRNYAPDLWGISCVCFKNLHKIYPFGHVADGNIHFIVGKNKNSIKIIDEINKIVYSPLKKLNGSISAEHGIGLDKKKYLNMTRSDDEIDLMRKIKKLFDPKLILNPGRIDWIWLNWRL